MESTKEMETTVDFIFKQYVFYAIIFIVEAVNKQLIAKEDNPIFAMVEKLGNTLKQPFKPWYDEMLKQSYEDLEIRWKEIAECDIDLVKNDKGENLKTVLLIASHLIDKGLHTEILKEYGVKENVDVKVNFDKGSITTSNNQNDEPPIVVEKEMPILSPVTAESDPLITTKPSPKRKRENSPNPSPPPSKRIKRLQCNKAFLAFKFDRNPLVGVKNYTLVTFTDYVIDEPCDEIWLDKLRGQLECLNVTHLFVQGRSQARYLREHIPNIYINVLPERNKETVCEECRTFSCSVGKVKYYMKYFHNFALNISCKK